MKLLNNDPTGDVAQYGEFVAWILMLARFVYTIFLGVAMLAMGIGCLLCAGMAIKLILMVFGAFTTDIPFIER